MQLHKLDIQLLDHKENIPYHLLLLADETMEAINRYVYESEVYIVNYNNQEAGVFCILPINETTIELKNIAISEEFQNKGIGSQVISQIKNICKSTYATLIVGTADHGYKQINFYEKNGFEKYDLKKNFFLDNYPVPIYENGQQLKDMVMLKYQNKDFISK